MDYTGDYEEPLPRFHEDIDSHERVTGLSSLALLRDDMAMSSQAFNLAAVDKFIMALEMNFLRTRLDDDLHGDDLSHREGQRRIDSSG